MIQNESGVGGRRDLREIGIVSESAGIVENLDAILHRALGDRAGEAGDIRGQQRIVLQVPGGVIADHVDDGRRGTAGVMQVGKAVGETRPQVKQRRGRLAGDTAKAVGGAGRDPLEQTKHRPQPLHAVERRDQMHLGSAGVGKADIDAAIDQRLNQ